MAHLSNKLELLSNISGVLNNISAMRNNIFAVITTIDVACLAVLVRVCCLFIQINLKKRLFIQIT